MTSSLLRALLVLSAIAAAGSAVADDTWRCGSKLVEIGMTRTEVLEYCGTPTEQAEEVIPVRNNSQVGAKTTKYLWTYKSYSATRVLVFDQDKLVSIQ